MPQPLQQPLQQVPLSQRLRQKLWGGEGVEKVLRPGGWGWERRSQATLQFRSSFPWLPQGRGGAGMTGSDSTPASPECSLDTQHLPLGRSRSVSGLGWGKRDRKWLVTLVFSLNIQTAGLRIQSWKHLTQAEANRSGPHPLSPRCWHVGRTTAPVRCVGED